MQFAALKATDESLQQPRLVNLFAIQLVLEETVFVSDALNCLGCSGNWERRSSKTALYVKPEEGASLAVTMSGSILKKPILPNAAIISLKPS